MHCDVMFAVIVTVGSYLYLYQRIPSFSENIQRGPTVVVTGWL